MKKISLIIAIAALAALVSCQKDNLTLIPENKVTPENYFKTESDLLLFSNYFYTYDLESAGYGSTTDLFVNNGISAYVNGTRNPATQGWSFAGIRQFNELLQNLDKCEDKAVALKYEAVARFFRAYAYFVRVRTYGDIPYYDKVLGSDDEDVFKARDDRGFVMDKVLEDFEFAAKNLPSSWETLNTRVTKWAALGMASRAALYEGTFRKYHGMQDAEKYLEACAKYAKEFITASPFTLYSTGKQPYRDLFNSLNAQTCEVVLARHYDVAYSSFHSLGYNNDFSRNSVTRRLLNHYLMKDGSRFTDKAGWETMTFIEETVDRDPRLAQTVMCPGYIQKGATTPTVPTLDTRTGYKPIKWIPEAAKCLSSSDDTDYPILRAAEVYLNYAEALAELGTLTQDDLNISVNKIRTRAGMPALNLATANADPDPYLKSCYPHVTKSGMTGAILEIRRERTIELVLENPDRMWDLFRWHEADQALQAKVPWYGMYIPGLGTYDTSKVGGKDVEIIEKNGKIWTKVGTTETEIVLSEGNKGYIVAYATTNYGSGWDDARDYLWPIPASQRELCPNLTQNPGYVDGIK